MLRSNSKSLGNHVVSTEEEKERLQRDGFAEKVLCFYATILINLLTYLLTKCYSYATYSRSVLILKTRICLSRLCCQKTSA